jgi:hypothetical protein
MATNTPKETHPILLKINEQLGNWTFKAAGFDTASNSLELFFEDPDSGAVKKIVETGIDLNIISIA